MNGRKIEDVKPHRCNIVEPSDAIAERAMFGRVARARAGKHFIPTTEARLLAVDDDAKLPRMVGGRAAIRIARHETGEIRAADERGQRTILR